MLASVLALAAFCTQCDPPGPIVGALRDPQVVLQGTALRDYLQSVGEVIDCNTDQLDAELMGSSVSTNSTLTYQFELCRTSPQQVLGLYDGHSTTPTLMPVFPDRAVAGWFAVASFRNSPVRVVVNVFDDLATLVSTTTFLGGDRSGVGFYLQGPNGTYYSQDARNLAGSPQALFYRGTGINTGASWLCFENPSLPGGSDQDFDDAIHFAEGIFASVVPVRATTWGQLKARFR